MPFPRALFAAAFLLASLPALYIAQLVRRFGVDVPLWDDWDMVPMITNAHLGQLTFAELFAQQLEARTLLPKLVFILLSFTGRFDARDAMLLSVVLCCVTAVGLFVLLRKSGLSPLTTTICFLLMVLGIFSPAQEELWLLASGFPSFMPVLFILAGLLVLRSGLALPVKFGLCAVFAVASTFTLAHGLLAFALTFPVFLLWERVPRWPLWLAAWCALGAACAVAYFWGYQKPPEVPDFAPPAPLLAYLHYALAFLGGAVAYGVRPFSNAVPLTASTIAGVLLLLAFAAAAAYLFTQRADRQLLKRALPWVALGLYSIGCAIPAALGRIGLGVQQALDSRYVTFSLYLTVALIALVPMLLPRRRIAVPVICTSLATVYVALYAAGFGNSVALLEERAARYRLGRAAVVFSQTLDTTTIVRQNNSTIPATARELAADLDQLGLLQPPLIRTNRVDALPHEIADGEEVAGAIDRSAPMAGGLYSVIGWAALEEKSRPADCVVLAYQARPPEWVVLAISDKVVPRPDVAERLGNDDQLWSGWTAKFPPRAVPPGAVVTVWAFDADEWKLYKLPGEIRLPRG